MIGMKEVNLVLILATFNIVSARYDTEIFDRGYGGAIEAGDGRFADGLDGERSYAAVRRLVNNLESRMTKRAHYGGPCLGAGMSQNCEFGDLKEALRHVEQISSGHFPGRRKRIIKGLEKPRMQGTEVLVIRWNRFPVLLVYLVRKLSRIMKFHELTNISMILLLISGLYLPSVKKLLKNELIIKIFLVLAVIPVLGGPVFAATIFLPLFYRDTPATVRLLNIVSGVSCWSILFKMYSFCYNQKNFEELIRLWDKSSEEILFPHLRKEILLNTKKISDRWVISFGTLLMVSAMIFCTVPFFTRKLEHPTALKYSTDSPEFEILVVYDLVIQSYLCLIVHTYNSFLMQIVAQEKASCEYLKKSLDIILGILKIDGDGRISITGGSLVYDRKGGTTRKILSYREACDEAETQIRIWIRYHQRLLRFHKKLYDMYQVPLSVDFAVLVLLICLIGYMIVSNSLAPAMIFISIAYCGTIYTIFYVTCYYGDRTLLTSQTLYEDAFGNTWYLYPRRLRTAFQIIMMNCRRPMTLKAFDLYPLSSESFAKIFRHSYSFFMFIVQVMNRGRGN